MLWAWCAQQLGLRGPGQLADLGRVPRVSRLMALAIHMDDLVRRGEVANYADLARLAHVSRARITQIMNLLYLAPDIQEEILNLSRVKTGQSLAQQQRSSSHARRSSWRTSPCGTRLGSCDDPSSSRG